MPQLFPFQREDVNFIKENGLRVLVASAPGTGKTAVAIRALAETHSTSLPAVVVCPASVLRHWGREVHRWAPGLHSLIINDSASRLPKIRGNTILIISWTLLDVRWADLVRAGVKVVVADEAHYAKNPSSLRSQALYHLTQSAKGVLLLTGTPIINTQQEMSVLTSLLGTEDPPMIRRLLEDVAPDVPPKARSYLYVNLPSSYEKQYEKAENDFEVWLRKEKEKLLGEGMAEAEVARALAAEALAKIGYLRRLAGVGKVHAAVKWIAKAVRIGEPVVVFCEHQAVLRSVEKRLRKQRIRYVTVEGKTSVKNRQEAVDAFQRNEYPVFLGTKAAKEGITLTAARHLLFIERFFTSSEEEQAEDRIRRIGQSHRTTVWFLHAMATVDDRVDAIVRGKRQIIRTAIGSKDIAETSTGNVLSLLQQWESHSRPDREASLDADEDLPPLPSIKEVQSICFYGERWSAKSASVWCKMNGYLPYKAENLVDRVKLHCNPVAYYQKGAFKVVGVAKDIRLILGKRLSPANERRAKAASIRAKK
jgi:SNF2 family DNA or RNA helicase